MLSIYFLPVFQLAIFQMAPYQISVYDLSFPNLTKCPSVVTSHSYLIILTTERCYFQRFIVPYANLLTTGTE